VIRNEFSRDIRCEARSETESSRRRLPITLLIIDEAHRAVTGTRYEAVIGSVRAVNPAVKVPRAHGGAFPHGPQRRSGSRLSSRAALCNVALLVEGIDIPACDAIVMAAPTISAIKLRPFLHKRSAGAQ